MTANNLKFNPIKFVHRTKEIEIVREALEGLKGDVPSSQPKSIAFQGEIGIGKSWLLQCLYSEFTKDEKLKAIYCDLKKYSGSDVDESVLEIMRLFAEGESIEFGSSLGQASAMAIEKIQAVLKQKIFVAFIDHVYESDWKLLRTLEEYILGPLAIESRTFFVLTGRGREYPWKTPELRLRAKFYNLEPFNQMETREQLARISYEAEQNYEEVYKNSNGNPLANSLLVDASKDKFDQAIEHVLESIPELERKRMRAYLEALSVLRYFDEERIPTMLKAYDASMEQSGEYSQASKIRDELVRTAFARWDDDKGGFVMDKYWQGLLSKYLELYEHKKWLALHQAALNLYNSWKKIYPTASKFWEDEIAYHKSFLDKKPLRGIKPKEKKAGEKR